MNDDQVLCFDEPLRIARELKELIPDANVTGLRSLSPAPIKRHLEAISGTLVSGDIRGAPGMVGAFKHLGLSFRRGDFLNAVLTGAWVQLALLEH
jgi:hypothetical protein